MMRVTMCVVLLLVLVGAAWASVASDATIALVEFATDTFTAPDTVGTSLGDPMTLDFSRKVMLTNFPGLRAADFYAGLSIASNGPALRGQTGLGLTNFKGNRISLIVLTAPYAEATWRIPFGNFGRLGLEPRIALSRGF